VIINLDDLIIEFASTSLNFRHRLTIRMSKQFHLKCLKKILFKKIYIILVIIKLNVIFILFITCLSILFLFISYQLFLSYTRRDKRKYSRECVTDQFSHYNHSTIKNTWPILLKKKNSSSPS
jgi:hypothetical protein